MSTARLWRTLLPLLILWLAFGLRLYRLDFQSIWWDEGHSLFVAGRPIADIPTLPAMDVHPPAYFVLLHLWQNLTGSSVFALRYLSVIFSLLTVALLWRFSQALARRPTTTLLIPGLTALLAALSPLYIAYAQEVRSYALITFLALASTFALWHLLIGPANQTQWIIGYICLTAACLYTHYFTIFLLLFQNLVWLSWVSYNYFYINEFGYKPPSPPPFASLRTPPLPNWERATAGRGGEGHRLKPRTWLILWLGTQLATLLLFLPQLRLALRQITTYTNPNLTPPTLPEFISRTWQAYTVGLTIDPAPAQWSMWLLLAILLANYQSPISNLQSPISNLQPSLPHRLAPHPPSRLLPRPPAPTLLRTPLSDARHPRNFFTVRAWPHQFHLPRPTHYAPRISYFVFRTFISPFLYLQPRPAQLLHQRNHLQR